MNQSPDTTDVAVPDPRSGLMVTQDVSIPDVMADALARAGVDATAVNVATTPDYWPLDLETLCVRDSNYRNAIGESPFMVITSVDYFPDDEKFKDYVGYFRAECVTEEGEFVAWTHYMAIKDSGEYGPLCQYIKDNPLPLAVKVVRVTTSNPGRSVYRPMPLMRPAASR